MEYNRPIAQMCPGDQIEGFYVLKSAMLKTSANGKSFLNAVLSDRDSAVAAKVWDYPGPISTAEEGKVVKIRGTVSEYRGDLQVVIDRIRLAEESDPVDLSLLVPVAPIDVEKTFEEVERLVASIQDKDLRAVCQIMLERHAQALRTIPAAKSVHHGFVSGLLMHTADMLRLADFLAAQYAAIVDRSLLLAGTLLHDFAKEQEFVRSELGLVTDYSVKGQLLGHLVLGAQEVARVAEEVGMPEERSLLLQHIDPLPPRRAGVRRSRAARLRGERAAQLHRPHRQPHGDLPGDVPGGPCGGFQWTDLRAGEADLPPWLKKTPAGAFFQERSANTERCGRQTVRPTGKERHLWNRRQRGSCWRFWTPVPAATMRWPSWSSGFAGRDINGCGSISPGIWSGEDGIMWCGEIPP